MNLRKAIAVRLVQTFGFDRERHVRFPWAAADGPVYYIVRRSLNWGDAGFFSNWLYALTHVAYAKEKGWIPVIDMRNYRTLYSEDHPVNGTRNAWEYYFEQPVDTRTAYRSGRFVLSAGSGRKKRYMPFVETDEKLELVPERARKLMSTAADYVHVRPDLLSSFEEWERTHFAGKRVLGVHWRGTDKRTPPPGHRPTTPMEALLTAIRNLSDRRKPDLVFLASDEAGIREKIESAAGIPVIEAEAYRLETGDARGLHLAKVRHARPNHRYLLGLEVLRDAWLLSRCEFLVHGHSNVINAVLLMRDRPYEDRILVTT